MNHKSIIFKYDVVGMVVVMKMNKDAMTVRQVIFVATIISKYFSPSKYMVDWPTIIIKIVDRLIVSKFPSNLLPNTASILVKLFPCVDFICLT